MYPIPHETKTSPESCLKASFRFAPLPPLLGCTYHLKVRCMPSASYQHYVSLCSSCGAISVSPRLLSGTLEKRPVGLSANICDAQRFPVVHLRIRQTYLHRKLKDQKQSRICHLNVLCRLPLTCCMHKVYFLMPFLFPAACIECGSKTVRPCRISVSGL